MSGVGDVDHGNHPVGRGVFSSRANIVLLGFLLIGGFFLVTEHRAHLYLAIPFLPWLLLLACPMMHLFMHHGHGEHGGDDGGQPRPTPPPPPALTQVAKELRQCRATMFQPMVCGPWWS